MSRALLSTTMRTSIFRAALLLLFISLFTGVAHAQITADTITSAGNTGGALTSSLTFAHTVGAGNNRLLVVGIAIRTDNSGGTKVGSVTWNGTALTCLVARNDANTNGVCGTSGTATNQRSEIWTLTNPASGTFNVVVNTVTTTGTAGTTTIAAAAQSYANVASVASGGTGASGSLTTTGTITGITTPVNGFVFDEISLAQSISALTATGTGHVVIADTADSVTTGNHVEGGTGQITGQTSGTAGWSWSGNSRYAETAAVLTPAVVPPTITKAFAPTSVPINGTSTLTLTIANPDGVTLTGVAVSDTFPSGLIIATPNGATNTCGGTLTATAGTGVVSLTGGSITANSSCAINVNVTSAAAATYNNTTGTVSSTNGGTGATSNTATLTVTTPPTITKAFGTGSIALNASTSMTLTITNPSATVSQTGLAVSDTFPAGLVVATPNGLSNTCGGTPTATAGTGVVSLTGGSLGTSASCQIIVNVTGTTAGSKTNTTGAVSSTNQGTGNTASATLTVIAPPTITKTFSPTSMPIGATSTLTLNFANPAANGAVALTGVAVSDALPAGLQVAATPATTNTCGATFAPNPGDTALTVSGGTVPGSSGTCAVSVAITATTSGSKVNTTGNVSSTNGGTGTTASATLAVEIPPTITKTFNPTTVAPNTNSLLTITITNPAANTVALTGLAISDTFPTNIVVGTPANLTNTCGGTPTGAAGGGTVSLTGGTVNASSSCLISFNVAASAVGSYLNTTGNVSTTNGGTGGTASATLTVALAPTTVKTFAPTTIALNGTSTLTVTISNPAANTGAMTGIAVTDTFPAGMVLAGTPNANNTCGGTFTPAAGSLTLSGGSIATPGTTCEFNVDVTATSNGTKNNTTSTVTTTNDGTGAAAAATLTVVSPPSIAKAFSPTTIAVNGTSTLTFTLTNPTGNTVAESGVAFSDTFPSDLVVAATPALTNTCGGSVTGATAASNTISLSGGTINTPAGTTCTISVAVTAPTAGAKANTSGSVSSTNGGTGTTASATLTVLTAPTVTKTFTPASVGVNTSSLLTITITNPNATTLTGVAISDTFPTNVVVQTPNGASTTGCGGTFTATAGAGSVTFTGGSVASGTPCVLKANVKSAIAGTYNNTTGTVSSTNGGTGTTASATLTVNSPPTITKAFAPNQINANGTSTVTLTLTNPNATTTLTGVNISDTFPVSPTGLQMANPPNVSQTCGATVSGGGAGSVSISFTNGTISAASSCTINFDVTSPNGGTFVNTTGAVSSTEGGVGGTATATLLVNAPPAITSANSANFILNAVSSFQVTATGTPAPTFSEVGALPTGITFSSSGLLSGTPTQAGSFPITITATNGNPPDATQAFTLSVVALSAYTQPFNTGHGWTFTNVSSTGTFTGTVGQTTNCAAASPGANANQCISAANQGQFLAVGSSTAYIHNPATYTWQTLGVPAGATVTSVAGGWFDHVSGNCNSATAGIQIFDAANSTQLSSTPIAPVIDVSGDTGGIVHAPGSAVLINTGGAAASGITIRFNLNPGGTILFGTCTIAGDNLLLNISYSLAASTPRRKGQVIIGMNAQPDGSLAAAWAYNVELSESATPINLQNVKFDRQGQLSVTADGESSLEGQGRKVTKIKLQEN